MLGREEISEQLTVLTGLEDLAIVRHLLSWHIPGLERTLGFLELFHETTARGYLAQYLQRVKNATRGGP